MDELLKILRRNALESPANLAKMLELSEDEVKTRIADYEQQGVIRGYQAIVNEDRLDLDIVQAAIEVKITPEREGGFDRIAGRIGKFPQVDSMFLMSGAYDLLVFVKGRTLKDVASFVSETLATIEGVISTATHFQLKVYKQNGFMARIEGETDRLPVTP